MRPNPERQIHRACGDVRAALFSALELLADGSIPTTASDDMFKVLSDLGGCSAISPMRCMPPTCLTRWSAFR